MTLWMWYVYCFLWIPRDDLSAPIFLVIKFKDRSGLSEERLSEPELKSIENIHSEKQWKKWLKKKLTEPQRTSGTPTEV